MGNNKNKFGGNNNNNSFRGSYNNFGVGNNNNSNNKGSGITSSTNSSQKFSYKVYIASKKMNNLSSSTKMDNNDA